MELVHLFLTEAELGEEQDHQAHQNGEQQSDDHIPCRAGETRRHDEKNGGDILGLARHGPEPDQGEGARHGDAGANAPVDHEDHGTHHHRQHHQRDQKPLAGFPGLPHDEGSHQAADARGGQAGQEHGDGKAFGQDGIKDC